MTDWQTLTQNVVVDVPIDTGTELFDAKVRMAYTLYADEPDTNAFTIKLDITYVHVRITLYSNIDDDYVHSSAVSWFLGNYTNLFDSDQYKLNQERTESGEYVNEFAWPYNSHLVGTSEELSSFSFENAWNDITQCSWNGSPLVVLAVKNATTPLSLNRLCVDADTGTVSESTQICVSGSLFADGSLFSGSNANGQSKTQITNNVVLDIASSSVSHRETGKNLTYDEEFETETKFLYVVNPYTDNSLASLEITKADMESYGLFKYDPSYFATGNVSDPYLVHAFTVLFTSWKRTYEGTGADGIPVPPGYSLLSRLLSSEVEYTLSYEDFTLPVYPLPSPIGPIEDNTVFRLKRQYNSDGSYVSDSNGNPILTWVKCERMGQE